MPAAALATLHARSRRAPAPLTPTAPAPAPTWAPGPQGAYLPGFRLMPEAPRICYGIRRLDHAVGNTHDLLETVNYIIRMTGEPLQRQGLPR